MTRKLAGYYCRLHLKFYGSLCVLLGSIMFIPLFVTALNYDVLEHDILFAFAASYIPWLIVFLCIASLNFRFRFMIRRQEQMFPVMFSDDHAVPLWRNAISFLSDDWFIHSGSAAFYWKHIRGITWEREIPGQGRGGYYLIIQTTDSRTYRLFIRTRRGCEKVRSWWKQKSEETYGL